MEITAAVAADLTALTQALDEPGADLAVLLHQLAADAKFAVAAFVGLTVRVSVDDHLSNLTAFEADAAFDDVVASVLIPMQDGADGAGIDLVLYASAHGAFIDLAADLAWLSGRALIDFALDQHLAAPERDQADGLFARSLVDQAIGVLVARGHTPEQAELALDARSARGDVARHIAARQIVTGSDGLSG